MKGKLKSAPPDAAGMRRRVEEALLKEALGLELTGRERRIVQWVRNGNGCVACAMISREIAGRRT
ncbi:hypothetical protein E0L93_07435 [Rubrobacter taiwanensis]|uniref:Uncharacterized protein n=1 Tax=Rubrobacter taiwanensis TaxID=185139 RepID=A0A4R1BJ90_9ACTN|nr:hypothetical protein [Rubrobacter taiwanensis]TCJ17354.1 hypothetical protein E0L93_07435 [Rubrobacter taiwanensis]